MSIFTKIRVKRPNRSAFNLSHEKKLSFNMGDLVPVFMQEVIPGDKFQVRTEQLIRFQALKSPMMHRVDVSTHFFFVPYRLIWSEFEKFITGGEDGTDNPVFPTLSANYDPLTLKSMLGIGTLADYLGYPSLQIDGLTGSTSLPVEQFSALPFRAYQTIYNEYYRDQNLTSKVEVSKNSGNVAIQPGSPGSTTYNTVIWRMRKRAWQKDYFTSALPWAQRGPQASMPAGQQNILVGTIYGEKQVLAGPGTGGGFQLRTLDGTNPAASGAGVSFKTDGTSASTINDLRRAYRLQEWLEKNARGGSRYIEQIFSHFGVKSSDARLQRPEYLGGSKNPIVISEVLQQSQSSQDSALGTMAGHGITASSNKPWSRYFEEHGIVLGIMSVTPRPAYMQGLPKIFNKFDKFDYFWPEFAHIGEQEIKNKELYYAPNGINNDKTFGYTPRYAEYRYVPDTVHGTMLTTLDFWHMAQKYSSQPNLNTSFVECNPTQRVFAVTDPSVNKLIAQVYHDFKAIRPIPKFATPLL